MLVSQLHKASGAESGLNIYPYITKCTLDIICGKFYNNEFLHSAVVWNHGYFSETAMGCYIKAQTEEETDYVRAIYS